MANRMYAQMDGLLGIDDEDEAVVDLDGTGWLYFTDELRSTVSFTQLHRGLPARRVRITIEPIDEDEMATNWHLPPA